MDTVPVPENTDEQAFRISAEQRKAEAQFRAQTLRAGMRYEMPDGNLLIPKGTYVTDAQGGAGAAGASGTVQTASSPTPAPVAAPPRVTYVDPEPLPEDEQVIIDLDIEEVDDKPIILRSYEKQPDGTKREVRTTLIVPAPHMQHAFMIGRYQTRIQALNQKLGKTEDDRVALQINDQIITLYKKMVHHIIPTMDDAILSKMNLRTLNEIVSVSEAMVQSAMSASASPLAYMRRIYRMVGEPHGSHDRGLLKWLKERFGEIEAIYAETDLPNE
jgi:hypothetical protein